MINAARFLDALKDNRPGLFCGVPCSLLKPLINRVIADPELHYVNAVSEGEAVGIAAGSSLAGRTGVVLLQNSGLGNTVNPVTSLINVYRIPCLLFVSHRGKPGTQEAVQHRQMGAITRDLLTLTGISHETLPTDPARVRPLLGRLFAAMEGEGGPAALVVERGMLDDYPDPENTAVGRSPGIRTVDPAVDTPASLTLPDALACLGGLLSEKEAVISATGAISRHLFHARDRAANFYMQGSMGTTAAIGLGVALTRPEHPVVVVDGDGSLLMRLGSLATAGYHQPQHFIHIVLDNRCYGTTGGQASASSAVSFPGLALEAGYCRAASVGDRKQLGRVWEDFSSRKGPALIHVRVDPRAVPKPARPVLNPVQIKARFMAALGKSCMRVK